METQTVVDYLRAEIDRKLAEAETIAKGASDDGRSVTAEEKKQIDQLLADAQSMKDRVKEKEEQTKLFESIEKMRGPMNAPSEEAPKGAKTIGEAFVKSDAYSALQHGIKSAGLGGNWTSGPVDLEWGEKATLTTTTGGDAISEDWRPGILQTLFRRLTVADLLASGTTDSNTVKYIRESVATNAAAATAEGADKPESTLEFEAVDEPVRKIATFLPVSDEMLEDVSQLRSYLDGRLRLFVQHAEEEQLLVGSGVAPQLTGLMNRTGIQTFAKPADENPVDSLYKAITNIRVNAHVEPDGIVVHPTNWQDIRLSKDANEQYYGGGPFTAAYGNAGGMAPDMLWGLPVVVTSRIEENTALVGAFGTQAQYFRRGGLTVEASNSHADFFRKNLTAIRAEERLALAVYRPAAFHTVTALDSEPV